MFLEETKPLKRRPVYEFGEFRLDLAERTLRRAGEAVPITPKALDTLLALIERRGAVVEKDELMRVIWPGTFVEETNLTFNISMLRKALAPFECIETIPRRGYRFTADVRDVTGSKGSRAAAPAPSRAARPTRRWLILSAAVLAVIGVGATWLANRGTQPRTLAILPFQSLDPAHPEETLQLGLADALITKLGGSPSLIVRPTSAVRRYSAAGTDPQAAGRDLGADSVLTGAFQRSAGRVRLTAQLIEVGTGRHLWDGQFDAQDGELLALEDEAVERIAGALSVRFHQARRSPVTPAPAAYENYLRGRLAYLQWSESGARRAADYFESVVKAEPEWAPGYVGLADAISVRVHWGAMSPAEATPRAAAAVRRAIALDDSLAEAHLALGRIALLYDWDRDSASREFRRALQLNPNSSQTHALMASLRLVEGNNDEATR